MSNSPEQSNPHSPAAAFDVFVAGAGSAGVAAAICAARAGMRTLLVDRGPAPGGNVANALVHSICGLYIISPDLIPRQANGGFAQEFALALIDDGAATGPVRMDRLDVLLQEPILFSRFCSKILAKEKNLTFLPNSSIQGVEIDDSRILSVRVDSLPDPVSATAFIDTTGEADLAHYAGAECESAPPGQLQRPAYIFSIGNVKMDAVDEEGRLEFSRKIVAGIRSGLLDPRLAAAVMRTTCVPDQVQVTIDLDAEGDHYSPLNPEFLTKLQILGQNLATQLQNHLRSQVTGFENCGITTLPARVGIRESRRIAGRHCLTAAEILEGAEFEDTVCQSAWPIELRETASGPKMKYPRDGKPCGVPLRALLSKDFDNLLMAGRCISSTHEAQGALRVIGTCLAMGQAAGLAAAHLVRSATRRIDPGTEATVAAPIREAVLEGI